MFFVFFKDTAPTEIYPLPHPDALPIKKEPRMPKLSLNRLEKSAVKRGFQVPPFSRYSPSRPSAMRSDLKASGRPVVRSMMAPDRKSTRLNSSHANISYAVFCLKKKKNT